MAKQKKTEELAVGDPSFESLKVQKVTLEARLTELTGEMEGLKDSVVAEKVQALELEKEVLVKKKEMLESTVKVLDVGISNHKKEIDALSEGALGKILKGIEKQRFFFIKNKKHIVFDAHSGAIFQNLEYVELQCFDADGSSEKFAERKKVINEAKYDGYGPWVFPSPYLNGRGLLEVPEWYLGGYRGLAIEIFDKVKPNNCLTLAIVGCTYSSSNDYLNQLINVENNSIYSSIDRGVAYAFPYCDSFCSEDLNPASKLFSSVERSKKVLEIFTGELWIPKFDEDELIDLYEKMFVERPAVLKELAEVVERLAEFPPPNPPKRGFSDGVDFERMIGEYDFHGIARSPIQYYDDAVRWYGALLADLDEFSLAHSELLFEAMTLKTRIASNRDAKVIEVLGSRTDYLVNRLDFGLEELQSSLIVFKEEAEQRRGDLARARSLSELRAVEKVERPDFFLLAEQSAELVKAQLDRVEWFQENKEAVTGFVVLHEEWVRRHHEFEHTTFEHFLEQCQEQAVDREVGEAWCAEWAKERRVAEERLLPLLKASLEGVISTDVAMDVAHKMEGRVHEQFGRLCIEQRIPIFQSFAGEPGGELLERLKIETELAKIDADFQKALEESIFSIPDTAGRLFLVRWAEGWFDSVVGRVIAFIEQGSIGEEVAKETLEEFRELKKKNLEAFLLDAKLYAGAREKIATEYNSLIFRLKTGLAKKTKKGPGAPKEGRTKD